MQLKPALQFQEVFLMPLERYRMLPLIKFALEQDRWAPYLSKAELLPSHIKQSVSFLLPASSPRGRDAS